MAKKQNSKKEKPTVSKDRTDTSAVKEIPKDEPKIIVDEAKQI